MPDVVYGTLTRSDLAILPEERRSAVEQELADFAADPFSLPTRSHSRLPYLFQVDLPCGVEAVYRRSGGEVHVLHLRGNLEDQLAATFADIRQEMERHGWDA